MDAFHRSLTIFFFHEAGIDLLFLDYPSEAVRESTIEALWNLIQDGAALGIPAAKTVDDIRESLDEVRRDGAAEYCKRYGIRQ